jgi:hypothetical protein
MWPVDRKTIEGGRGTEITKEVGLETETQLTVVWKGSTFEGGLETKKHN